MKKTACIILAAGKGERMKSETPKVLHNICGEPMLVYVLNLSKKLKFKPQVIILGHRKELFGELIKQYKLKVVYQDKLLGTADAVKRAKSALSNFSGNVLVLYGDQPLLKEEVIVELISKHNITKSAATVLTAKVDNPFGYGRVIRDNFSNITQIVEEKDLDARQKGINEVNTGVICFNKDLLFKILPRVQARNAKKEYYLTDVIKIMAQEGHKINSLCIIDEVSQAQGINSRVDLSIAQNIMRRRIIEEHMNNGVSVVDARNTYIDQGCIIGEDTVIYPFTVIEKGVKIGKFCHIGPFCRLRDKTTIKDRAVIGNFTEIVRSFVGKDTFMKHFSYLGDAQVGDKVNIGCGAVVANYDGRLKHKTTICDGAFIGTDTVLRAPVKVGKKAVTGAGSVVTKDVKAGKTVVGVPARELIRAKNH